LWKVPLYVTCVSHLSNMPNPLRSWLYYTNRTGWLLWKRSCWKNLVWICFFFFFWEVWFCWLSVIKKIKAAQLPICKESHIFSSWTEATFHLYILSSYLLLFMVFFALFNSLNTELNPICHLLALLVAHLILHVSRIRVNSILRACSCCYLALC